MKNAKKGLPQYLALAGIVLLITCLLLCRFFLGTITLIHGSSMSPTFEDGDFLPMARVWDSSQLSAGDIVIVRWDDRYIIKRLHATPGMHTAAIPADSVPELTMGEGEYYILGDNRTVSLDSRTFGTVTREQIVYKAAGHQMSIWSVLAIAGAVILLTWVLACIAFPEEKTPRQQARSVFVKRVRRMTQQ